MTHHLLTKLQHQLRTLYFLLSNITLVTIAKIKSCGLPLVLWRMLLYSKMFYTRSYISSLPWFSSGHIFWIQQDVKIHSWDYLVASNVNDCQRLNLLFDTYFRSYIACMKFCNHYLFQSYHDNMFLWTSSWIYHHQGPLIPYSWMLIVFHKPKSSILLIHGLMIVIFCSIFIDLQGLIN